MNSFELSYSNASDCPERKREFVLAAEFDLSLKKYAILHEPWASTHRGNHQDLRSLSATFATFCDVVERVNSAEGF